MAAPDDCVLLLSISPERTVSRPRVTVSLVSLSGVRCGDLHTHMHFSSCHTVRAREATFTLTESNTMVKPLEKSTKFWDGHELLRLVEL